MPNTTKQKALLVLEDGTTFEGFSCGAKGESFGELCFNTSMAGYLETITDPSYAGEILTFAYTEIGNYGVQKSVLQAKNPALRGVVFKNVCFTPSHFSSEMSLPSYLAEQNVVGIYSVDTRSLVKHIRNHGAKKAVISTVDLNAKSLLQKVQKSASLVGQNMVETVEGITFGRSFADSGRSAVSSAENGRSAVSSADSGRSAASFGGDSNSDTSFAYSASSDKSLADNSRSDVSSAGNNNSDTSSAESGSSAVSYVDCGSSAVSYAGNRRPKVIVYDCGVKASIINCLEKYVGDVKTVPWNTSAESVLAQNPDAVFFSNGPGDPQPVDATYFALRTLLGKVPIFGICLGLQMLGLAAGGKITKLKFGHRGINHPIQNLITKRTEITSQNHGFAVDFTSLGDTISELSGGSQKSDLRYYAQNGISPVVQNKIFGKIRLTHVNLNDATVEGFEFLDKKAFGVQYHPESTPGPIDSRYLFDAFRMLICGETDYLSQNTTQLHKLEN